MEQGFFVFDPISVRIPLEGVLNQLGYPREGGASSRARERVGILLEEAAHLLEPKGAFVLREGEKRKRLSPFPEAEGIVMALATIGYGMELKAKELIESGRAARGVIADAIGTLAAELAADFVENKIRGHAAGMGWKVSRRYAPGYCGWDVKAQKELFDCFPHTLGITLTKSCLMIPEKSLSFVCLLSRERNFGKIELDDCRDCMQEECPYRRN